VVVVGVVNSQRPAVVRLPVRIEIQHERYLPLGAAVRLIDVAGVGSARRIAGVVQFQLEQPQQQITVELQTQLFEPVEQHALAGRERLAQPAGEISADDLPALLRAWAADARRREIPARLARVRTFPQRLHLIRRRKPVSNRDAS
jgi:hypothetical protein